MVVIFLEVLHERAAPYACRVVLSARSPAVVLSSIHFFLNKIIK